MPPANRHNPTRTACPDSQFSLMEFLREYPDAAACLEHLWRERYSEDGEHADCPKCEREGVVFKRYATAQGRPVVDLHRVRSPRPPDGRDDLPRLVNVAAPLVLRDVPHGQHS